MPLLNRNILHDGTQFALALDTRQDLTTQVESQAMETLNKQGKTIKRVAKRFMINALVSRVQLDFDQLRSTQQDNSQPPPSTKGVPISDTSEVR